MTRISLTALLLGAGLFVSAQQKPLEERVLFTVEDDTVTAGEYMAVYNKNRNIGEDIDPKTPSEYLDLYMNFKLKVHEAKEMGMDTMPAFRREYTSYRDQLAKPYLSDRDVTQELVKEAYDRMKEDVRASHIMVEIPQNATPEDTAAAHEKIMNIRKQLEGGAYFNELAEEYSNDTYSAQRGGDLGFFTVFNMVYPFEDAAYTADIGEVVGPIRSQFGYHLVKTTDRRPARYQLKAAHIMLVANDESTEEEKQNAEKKINEIYQELEAGADFAVLARQYSEDQSSAKAGGMLEPFGINRMFPEFENAAFGLKEEGSYTKPVKTPVGWHIIKLVEREEIPAFEEMKTELKARVDRDSRSQQSRISIVKKLKKEYNYREYPEAIYTAYDRVDESFLEGKYKKEDTKTDSKLLFEFANKEYTIGDFLNYVEKLGPQRSKSLNRQTRVAYTNFSEAELLDYEKSRLEEKYPEFELLSREYYEGILLFDLTEDRVWRKSVVDSTGLEEYYNQHAENYRWDERYHAYIIDAKDKKVLKSAKKMLKKGNSAEEIEKELNEDSQLSVKLDSGLYTSAERPILKQVEKETGFSDVVEKDDRLFLVKIEEVVAPSTKTFEEARGAVISDYQNYLEEKWIEELKQQYEVEVNEDVLAEVIDELESQS